MHDRARGPTGRTKAPVPHYVLILRWFFVLVLLASSIGKLLDNRGFAAIVGTYHVFPDWMLLPAGLALGLAELALAAWLVRGIYLRRAALATVLFQVGYLAWLALAYARGLDIPNCGCFGIYWGRPLTGWRFVEDGVLLAAAVVFWLAARHHESVGAAASVGQGA